MNCDGLPQAVFCNDCGNNNSSSNSVILPKKQTSRNTRRRDVVKSFSAQVKSSRRVVTNNEDEGKAEQEQWQVSSKKIADTTQQRKSRYSDKQRSYYMSKKARICNDNDGSNYDCPSSKTEGKLLYFSSSSAGEVSQRLLSPSEVGGGEKIVGELKDAQKVEKMGRIYINSFYDAILRSKKSSYTRRSTAATMSNYNYDDTCTSNYTSKERTSSLQINSRQRLALKLPQSSSSSSWPAVLAYLILGLLVLPAVTVANVLPQFVLKDGQSEIVLRLKEGPATPVGNLIYKLKGIDRDGDTLTFGLRGQVANELLRIENLGKDEANLYLRKELDREVNCAK